MRYHKIHVTNAKIGPLASEILGLTCKPNKNYMQPMRKRNHSQVISKESQEIHFKQTAPIIYIVNQYVS